jgi:predicted cobalt transporter CbtA
MDNYDNWRAEVAQRVRDKIADHRARTVRESFQLTFDDPDPQPEVSWEDLETTEYAPHDTITREIPALSSEMVTSPAYAVVMQQFTDVTPRGDDVTFIDKIVVGIAIVFILIGFICVTLGYSL